MNLLDVSYTEACDRLEARRIDVKLRAREADDWVKKVTQSREQVEFYNTQIQELKNSKVCSLKEFKEAKSHLWMTQHELSNFQNQLEIAEASLAETRKNLEQIKVEIDQLKQQFAQYGKLLRFPSDDRRSTPTD